jgi:hypothetical protein
MVVGRVRPAPAPVSGSPAPTALSAASLLEVTGTRFFVASMSGQVAGAWRLRPARRRAPDLAVTRAWRLRAARRPRGAGAARR